jgi:hypothetical protein
LWSPPTPHPPPPTPHPCFAPTTARRPWRASHEGGGEGPTPGRHNTFPKLSVPTEEMFRRTAMSTSQTYGRMASSLAVVYCRDAAVAPRFKTILVLLKGEARGGGSKLF